MRFVIIYFFTITALMGQQDWSDDKNPKKWNDYAKNKINEGINKKININVAKNVIMFLGDGMGVSTVTAGRIRKGQQQNRNGEEEITNMEKLDHIGLSKTYNIDAQTADSAGTATAYLSGVKTRIGVIGLDGNGIDCPTSKKSKLETILKWAHYAGKSTGIVTTTRVTHATPAGCYANVPSRDWETFDGSNFKQEYKDQGCLDIADQLITENSFINLVMGGGRRNFLKNETGSPGYRIDNRDLIEEWKQKMQAQNKRHTYVTNLTDFRALKPNQYEHMLVLLADSDLSFEADRNPALQPSIVDMTEKAIELLSTNPKGFFLLVEGGKIDHGHHNGNARRALDDFVVFDNAIGMGVSKTDEKDTLIVVTADHSHVFTIGGYSNRGNPLFDVNRNQDGNPILSEGENRKLTFTAIGYSNGPGAITEIRTFNLTFNMTSDLNFKQEAVVFLSSETHGGEDVAVFARGPMSHLLDASFEQSFIAHVMAYSACVGPYNSTTCESRSPLPYDNGISRANQNWSLILSVIFFALVLK